MKKSIGVKTIVYPTPVFVIGTYDQRGNPNIMTASWAGICCSSPPCVAVSLREATYSYGNIVLHKAFTVNIPSQDQMKDVDYIGIVSGRNENKFEKLSLTAVEGQNVHAPYVKEFPLVLECQVIQTIKIGLHTQFIGEIKDVKVEESYLGSDDLPNVEEIKPFMFAPGNRKYYAMGECLGKAFSVGQDR